MAAVNPGQGAYPGSTQINANGNTPWKQLGGVYGEERAAVFLGRGRVLRSRPTGGRGSARAPGGGSPERTGLSFQKVEFPVMQGKYREFSQITPKSGPHAPYKDLNFLVLLVEFPTRRNREFFDRNRELG